MGRFRAILRRLWPFGRSERDAEDGEGTVWDATPSWQYEGRLAEAGGITRGEQERAVADLQERVDRESDVSEHRR